MSTAHTQRRVTLWNSPGALATSSAICLVLLVPLPSMLFGGKFGAWPVLADVLLFAAYATLRARVRDVLGGSIAAQSTIAGTLAAVLGCAIWLVTVRVGEYLLFFLIVGIVPILGLGLVHFAIAAVIERHVEPLRGENVAGQGLL